MTERSLARTCFELADGDPLDALWLGVRATQLNGGAPPRVRGRALVERPARGGGRPAPAARRRRKKGRARFRVQPQQLPEALRLLAEGLTREEISERLGWPALTA